MDSSKSTMASASHTEGHGKHTTSAGTLVEESGQPVSQDNTCLQVDCIEPLLHCVIRFDGTMCPHGGHNPFFRPRGTPSPKARGTIVRLCLTCTKEGIRQYCAPNKLLDTAAVSNFYLVHGGKVLKETVGQGKGGTGQIHHPEIHVQMGTVVWVLGSPSASSPLRQLDQCLDLFPLLGERAPPEAQPGDQKEVAAKFDLLKWFVGSRWKPTKKREHEALEYAVAALAVQAPSFGGPPHITWYGNYGCALLAIERCRGRVHLVLACLDEHAFGIHSGQARRTYVSHAGRIPCQIDIGTVDIEKYAEFQAYAAHIVANAGERRGGNRSAVSNKQGNQKTPAMIEAVLKDALDGFDRPSPSRESTTKPRGGFTDVGLHTGGKARNTAWPLVQAVLHIMLEENEPGLFNVMMAQLKLACLEQYFAARFLSPKLETARPQTENIACHVATVMQMIEATVVEGVKLADRHYDGMGAFAARCTLVRDLLDCKIQERAHRAAQPFTLQPVHPGEITTRDLNLVPPEGVQPVLCVNNLAAARRSAKINLKLLPAPEHDSWHAVKAWSRRVLSKNKTNPQAWFLVINTVESFVFQQVLGLQGVAPDVDDVCANMEPVMETYRETVKKLRKSKMMANLMSSEICSREVLSVWAMFCVIHSVALSQPLGHVLADYSVALQWTDLRHLVLSDKLSCDAAGHVAAYLRKHSSMASVVFSLREQDQTFDFARQYAEKDSGMQRIWREVEARALERRDQHWATICEGQRQLAKLKRELERCKKDKRSATNAGRPTIGDHVEVVRGSNYGSSGEIVQDDKDHSPYTISGLSGYFKQDQVKLQNKQAAQRKVEAKEEAVRQAGKPPPGVLQPFPKAATKAFPLIFCGSMPKVFQILSGLSFTAQQMLLPSSDLVSVHVFADLGPSTKQYNVGKLIKTDKPMTEWSQYCQTHGYFNWIRTKVIFGSAKAQPNEYQIGPSLLSEYLHKDQGIWHPDGLLPQLFWKGGGCTLDERKGTGLLGLFSVWFDPFVQLDNAVTIHKFTEQLPGACQSLQWAMEQHGAQTKPIRSNLPLATQDQKPSWLPEKSQYLAFCGLRAFPHSQMLQMCAILRDQSLPLDHPAVRLLLFQTLCHVGDLSDDPHPTPVWRRELTEHGGWAKLRTALDSLASELQNKPRAHGAIWTLGRLAAVASQWDLPTRGASRNLAQISLRWAGSMSKQLETASPHELPELRSRCCRFCMYGIISHSTGELLGEDLQVLLRLILLAQHSRLFEDGPAPVEISQLTHITSVLVARRMPEMVVLLDQDHKVPALLTTAVQPIIATTPSDLKWNRVCDDKGQPTLCYEAVCSQKHLYSVNVQTGIVLFDGQPPRRLPASILKTQHYRRCFGERNFEVTLSQEGVLTTIQRIKGCTYSFFEHENGEVTILEKERGARDDLELELLNGANDAISSWGRDLPIRLQRMHSHWYCRKSGLVVFRGQKFDDRSVAFLLRQGEDSGDGFCWECFRVPSHWLHRHWTDLALHLCEFDRLVRHTTPDPCRILTVLRKFEIDPGLIHTFCRRDDGVSTYLFELPRYELGYIIVDGRLKSTTSRGFSLGPEQQLSDTLHGFQQCLVLQSDAEPTVTKIVIPEGTVERSGSSGVIVNGPSEYDANRSTHTYTVNPRFGNLEVAAGPLATEARLQLAALYAATDSKLPESRLGQTGGEVAVELLRQSWSSKPMRAQEYGHLESISRGFDQHSPSLSLLCHELVTSAHTLEFLPHKNHVGANRLNSLPRELYADASTDYKLRKQRGQLNPRAILTIDEETEVFGRSISGRSCSFRDRQSVGELPTTSAGACLRQLKEIEAELSKWRRLTPSARSELSDTSPVSFPEGQVGIKKQKQLQDSWAAHLDQELACLAEPAQDLVPKLLVLFEQTQKSRLRLENELQRNITQIPACAGWRAPVVTMRRAANLIPSICPRDLAQIAVGVPQDLHKFNPFLAAADLSRIQEDILVWLQLCVFEDKLSRMHHLAKVKSSRELERELQEVGRLWEPREHPEWLVFEVEQRLQIRHVQYKCAKSLMENRGSIQQLNMGEGKTRVILPMVVLALARPDRLMRLHFLAPLLGEAYHFLQRNLTASLMLRRIYLLPFERSFSPNLKQVQAMHAALLRCMAYQGVVCVAPEHRLSLHLKWHDLHSQIVRKELDKLHSLPYFDVLDESDEVLSHKYQLRYAVGKCIPLPARDERCMAVEALLKQLRTNPDVAKLLELPDVALRLKETPAGTFGNIRLLTTQSLQQHYPELLVRLVTGVMDQPPYHMGWLVECKAPRLRSLILAFIVEPDKSLKWFRAQPEASAIQERHLEQLLALRGLCAWGILKHCLCRRHRVDYGVDPRRNNGKTVSRCRLAVPYRASDTPHDRAEYAQPETQIVYTLLSYYHQGISRGEVKEVVRALLTLGPVARQEKYKQWLESADLSADDQAKLKVDSAEGLDPSSEEQLGHLTRVFSHNMETINCWLDICVFPLETMQFPHSLMANAFNLTDGQDVVGFSGTTDNSDLLPFNVGVRPSTEPAIAATDGKMVDLVLRHSIVQCFNNDTPLSDQVLDYAVRTKTDALIDAGATMAGLKNKVVAEKLLKLLPSESRQQGVVYFDDEQNRWCLVSKQRRTWPLGNSPIRECDAFVYYDESRCRGADMKLDARATAVLTVGCDMCKDKLMQAAGRMRKLMYGQKLVLGVPFELISPIRAANRLHDETLGPLHLVQWVARNTVKATETGLPEWANQAIHYATTQDPENRLRKECLGLRELYGKPILEQPVQSVVKRWLEEECARVACTSAETKRLERLVTMRIHEHAADVTMIVTRLDQECERELENERECQTQVERSIPRKTALTPRKWLVKALQNAWAPVELPNIVGVVSLSVACRQYYRKLQSVAWDSCKHKGGQIYMTYNFVHAITARFDDQLGNYMRPVNFIVLFPSGDCLLLSEWEVDQALQIPTLRHKLFHVSDLRPPTQSVPGADTGLPQSCAPFSNLMRAALHLFAGGTQFGAFVATLKQLLPSPEAKIAAKLLIEFRGCKHKLHRSHLEQRCDLSL